MSVSSLSPISEVESPDVKIVHSKSETAGLESTLNSDKLDVSIETVRKTSKVNDSKSTSRDISYSEDTRSPASSPGYTEEWEELSSPRKTAMESQFTHRSRESGRLSPILDTNNVEVGSQPLQLPRFNEPLKLRKGRHFVDFETPAPTVVYVPHKKVTHGRWTNVSVQRRNGRYVVIEQRPVHTQFTDASDGIKHKYNRDLFGPDTSWVKKKAPWRWSTKGNYIERSVNKGFYEPYLPPMKPRFSHVGSRVGSMDNYDHIPGGGQHKVPNFKLKWEAEAKIDSLPTTFRADGSETNSLKLPNLTPRFGASAVSGSFTSIHYTPGGSVILRKQRPDVKSQVGSLDNISHSPGGGDVSIPQNKIKWKKESKIGSLDNITHLPKSSNVQIFNEKLKWRTDPKVGSLDNSDHVPKGAKFKVPNFPKDWTKSATSKVGSLSNVSHQPGGGNFQMIDLKPNWKSQSKVDSKWKFNYDYKSLFTDDDDLDMQSFSHASTHRYTV